MLHVKVREPQFEGQTKTKLGNSEVEGIVKTVVNEHLGRYLEEHPPVGEHHREKAVSAARAREAARKARDLTRKKSALETSAPAGQARRLLARRPGALRDLPRRGRLGRRLGQAGARPRSSRRSCRCAARSSNVEKARIDKILSNEEIRTIITAIGAGIKEDFTLENARYHKIIIMTDADVDGAHIRTLLLTFFFRQMPELIDAGYVYIAQPPLYRVAQGQGGVLRLRRGGARRVRRSGSAATTAKNDRDIQRYKGLGEMNPGPALEDHDGPERAHACSRSIVEDAVEADRIFEMLMGDEVEPRRAFIEENAKFVRNLDI